MDRYPARFVLNLVAAAREEENEGLAATAWITYFSVWSAIDKAFGGKGEAVAELARKLTGEKAPKKRKKGLTKKAKNFFDHGLPGVVPVERVTRNG